MTTAVYIVSPEDKIDAFASKARELEFDSRRVLVDKTESDIKTVVFIDGPPIGLKNAIANNNNAQPLLEALKSRVENMLKVERIGYDDLNLFIHFRKQGPDELILFNNELKSLTTNFGSFWCYAISFGNTYPPLLFPNSKFSPPNGDGFVRMCRELQNGGVDDFEHLRALRVLLPMYSDIQGSRFILSNSQMLNDIYGDRMFYSVLSDEERECLFSIKNLKEFFKMENKDDWVKTPDHLSYKEYEFLMLNLLSKGDKK